MSIDMGGIAWPVLDDGKPRTADADLERVHDYSTKPVSLVVERGSAQLIPVPFLVDGTPALDGVSYDVDGTTVPAQTSNGATVLNAASLAPGRHRVMVRRAGVILAAGTVYVR